MKRPALFLPALFAVLWLAGASAAETRTVTLAVDNMTCKLCPITIRKALEKVDGVQEAKVDFASKTATVTFDPARTNVEALTRATKDAGYPSRLKESAGN